MKKRNKIISLILAFSLLLSSFVITASAASEGSTGDIANADFYESTATFTKAEKNEELSIIRASYSGNLIASNMYGQYLYGGKDLQTYIVRGNEESNTNEYIMIVPTADAAQSGKTENHAYFSTQYSQTQVLTYGANQYYVFELDIATESELLTLDFQLNARYVANVSNMSSSTHTPGNTFTTYDSVALLNITPGVFYHLTFVAHPDTNTSYVYLHDQLIKIINNGVIEELIEE